MYNYHHSLRTLQKALQAKNYNVHFTMEAGKPCYHFLELENDKYATCGWAYSAKDAAEITNKLLKLV